MAENYNPFEALIALTPDALRTQRETMNYAQTKDLDYWVGAAGRAGLGMRNSLLAQGRGMTPEDQRAQRSQTILEKAQTDLAEMMKGGNIDPYDAQELAVSQAMTDFMAIGDYQAAQSLIPSLNQIRTYRAELDKLSSESYENRSSGLKSMADAGRVPYQIDSDIAQEAQRYSAAGASDAAAQASLAHARLRDRTDPNLRRGATPVDKDAELSQAERREKRGMIAGTLNLADRMDDLMWFADNAARAASLGGQGINVVKQQVSGLANTFSSKGSSVGGFQGLSDEPAQGREGVSPKQIVLNNYKSNPNLRANFNRISRTIGMDVTAYESLVIDAAYALARANDPGGRLSNNDFDYALKMLGAVQDVKSMKEAFQAIERRGYENLRNQMASIGTKSAERYFKEAMEGFEARHKAFTDQWGAAATGTVSSPLRGGKATPGKPAPGGSSVDDRIQQILGGP
jgi:hypothetical protein